MEKDKEQKPPLRIAIYLRVSTDDQAEKYGIKMQEDVIRMMIQSKGEQYVFAGEQYIYSDDGESGTTPLKDRPAFQRMMEDIESIRPFDIVAVYKLDRFARKLKILVDLIDYFEMQDIKFISANESIDTSTPFGKAMLGIMGVIAELELETIKMRMKDGRRQANKKGTFMGQSAPYGYNKNMDGLLEIFPEESVNVKRIFESFVMERESAQDIATAFTEEGIPSPDASAILHKKRRGEPKKKNDLNFWRSEKIRDILRNEIYIGEQYFNKMKGKAERELSDYHPPYIVDRDVFNNAQTLLDRAKALSNTTRSTDDHLYLLGSLLRCDACRDEDGTVYSWSGFKDKVNKGNEPLKYSYSYKCNHKNPKKFSHTCQTIPIPAQPLEDYIVNFARELLKDPEAIIKHQENLKSTQLEDKRLRQRRNVIQDRLNGIPAMRERNNELYELGDRSKEDHTKKVADFKLREQKFIEELQSIDVKLAKSNISSSYIAGLEVFKERYASVLNDKYADRRELAGVLRLLIDEIIIRSRPRNDSDVIAGKKKLDQLIPHQIEIKIRLPKNMLTDLVGKIDPITSRKLFGDKFAVKNRNL